MFHQKRNLLVLIATFILLLIIGGVVGSYQQDKIRQLEQQNEVLLSENEGLRSELQRTHEQLLISNDKLQKLETKSESEKYQDESK